MSTSSLSPEEVRAAAEIYRELGPDYHSAVVESFLDRVIGEIDARVEGRTVPAARASGRPPEPRPGRPPRHMQPAVIALGSMVLGIPLSGVAVAAGAHPAGFWGLLVVWLAIAAINIAYAIRLRPRDDQR